MLGSNYTLQAVLVAKDRLTPVLNNATVATQRFAGISVKSLATTALKFMGVAGAAYATYRALKFAVTSYSDFQNAMSEVSTLVDTSRVNMDSLTQSVLRFSNATGVSATQTAKALYQTISAGVDASHAMDVLKVAQKTALGGVAGLPESVDLLTNILNAYHLKASKAIDVSDKMFIAVKEGKTTISELAQNLGMVAPIASQAGVGIGEMAASVAELTKGGLNTSEAVTGLRQLINSIISPSAEAAKYAHKLGLAFSAKTLQHEGLIKFLTQLREKTHGSVDKLTKLIPDVRALNAVLALTGSGYKDLIRINDEMNYSFGATDLAADKMRRTFKYQAQLAGTHVKNAFISLGNAIAFVLKPALVAFNGLFGKDNNESDKLKKLQNLLNIYDQLKNKTKLTADEEERLQDVRNAIADLFPQLVKAYDNEGNAIKLDADNLQMLNEQYAIQALNKIPKLVDGLNRVANYHIGGDIIRTTAFDAMKRLTDQIQKLKAEIPSQGLQIAIKGATKAQEQLSLIAPGVGEQNFTQIRYQAISYVKNPNAYPELTRFMESGSKAGQIMKVYVDYLRSLIEMNKKGTITQNDLNRAWNAFANEGLKSVTSIRVPREELNKLQKQLDDIANAYVQQATSVLMAERAMKTYVESLPKKDQIAWINRMKELATPAYNWGQKFMKTYAKGVIDGGGVLKPEIEKLLKSLSDYLELHSPARKGPLSRLDQWGLKFIPTWLDGVKKGAGKINNTLQSVLGGVANFFNKIGLGNMSNGIERIMGKFSRIKNEIGDITGAAKDIMAIFTGNPVGGLMTVIAKIVSLMKTTPEGRKALQKIFDVFKKIEKPVEKILDSVIKLLAPLTDLLADILAPIADFLASAIIQPLQWLTDIINAVISGINRFFNAIKKVGEAIFNFITAPFKAIWDAVSGFFGWIGSLFGGGNKAHENVQKAKEASNIEKSKSETKNESKAYHIGTIEIHSNATDPKAVADEVLRQLGLEAAAHG